MSTVDQHQAGATAATAGTDPPGPDRPDGAPAGGATVRLADVSRSFGTVRALDHLTLELAPGELVALLGPSGCGKTTALRALAGFETIDSGQVLLDGRDISRVPARRRGMGMVFQSYSLFPTMTAAANVAFGLRLRGADSRRRQSRSMELLEQVGLTEAADRYPHQLSGGQQQRVALARALAIEPRVLLLDEPLSALDARVRLQLREQIRVLATRTGTTTLFVTHDQEEALSIADRVGVMAAGRLQQLATPAELYARPAGAFVAEFIGTMNRVPGTMIDASTVAVLGGRAPVASTGPDLSGGPALDRRPGTEVDVLVRPEGLRASLVDHGDAIVSGRTFLGSTTRLHLVLGGATTVLVDTDSLDPVASAPDGSSAAVELRPRDVLVAPRR